MMTVRRILIVGAVVAVAFSVQAANAAMIISIDMDTAMPGIQDTRDAVPGDTFTADVMFEVGVDPVMAYAVSVHYDTVELDALGAAEGKPFGEYTSAHLNQGVGDINDDIGGGWGWVKTMEAYDVTEGGFLMTNNTYVLGSIDFEVDLPIDDGLPDVVPGFHNAGVDGFLDPGWNTINADLVEFRSGYVTPEPASMALLLLGGLAVLRRR